MKGFISTLEEHPNAPAIARLSQHIESMSDKELPRLAVAWRDSLDIVEARSRGLAPDSPLIIEVLELFQRLEERYESALEGMNPFVETTPGFILIALQTIKDAITAEYARPILSNSQYQALIGSWHVVYPRDPYAAKPNL